MKLICLMKSRESFNRIKIQTNDGRIEWEEYIDDLDILREKLASFVTYDFAVLDEKVWWVEEAAALLMKFDTPIIYFEGNFEDTVTKILAFLPSAVPEDPEVLPELEPEISDDRSIRYVEKEVIVEREKKVRVPVYQEVYTSIPSKQVIVANLSNRAGSTFVTLALAKGTAEQNILCSVVEPPIDKPYLFDTLGMEIRLNKTNEEESLHFYSYPHEIVEENLIERNRETIEDGIVWLIPDSRRPLITSWDYPCMMRLLYASKRSSLTFIDVGDHLFHPSVEPIIVESDMILIVLDPLPTEIMQNYDRLERILELKKKGYPIQIVFNRWTSGVDQKELLDFLRVEPMARIPDCPTAAIHESIYACHIPYEHPEIKPMLEKPINQILMKLIPKDYWLNESSENKESIINRLSIKLFKKR